VTAANRAEASAAAGRGASVKINPVLNYSNSKAFGFFMAAKPARG
jgi:hypothetical protein